MNRVKRQKKLTPGQKWYREYLASPRWLLLRSMSMLAYNGKCGICGAKAVNVHHRNYRHVGKSFMGEFLDLLPVCRGCHKKIHGIK